MVYLYIILISGILLLHVVIISSMTGMTGNQRNPSIAAPTSRAFEWWDPSCNDFIDEIENKGGERFIAFHDEDEGGRQVDTQNWLHVTSSVPNRRVQYELRFVPDESESDNSKENENKDGNDTSIVMAGVVRFGSDCEGPPGFVHGGAMATVADAATATTLFKNAGGRWGFTTKLECNYRVMLPVCTPVCLEAKVVELRRRKASVEWGIYSLTDMGKDGKPVRYSFGKAEFLLPRE